ncbi:MAG TPA: VWA domain-containing protein [Vicinamibacterales bacterium]|nr:VWA domain-containing protein [Vicinamibacterales bacterium]
MARKAARVVRSSGRRCLPERLNGVPWVACWPVAAVLAAFAVAAPQAQEESQARFSSGVQAVEVYATVTDGAGEPVTGLRADDFQVDDDGRPQAITTFAEGAFPLTVALGVDRSLSMAGEPLRLARRAAQSFLRQLRPGDRSMVVAINADAEVVASLDVPRDAQMQSIAALDAWSTTALRDAVVKTLDRLAPESGRQALVVFSDGTDRYSQVTAAEMLDRARRGSALVYPIVFGRTAVPALSDAARLTGGRAFVLRDARELDGALGSIARELRHQYLLGYAPAGAAEPGRWHPIRVRVRGPQAGSWRIRARDGYER